MLLAPSISPGELKKVSHAFCEEIQHAYAGLPSSLPFLIHKLPPIHPIKDGTIIQVMVFGGTIFKTARFHKKHGEIMQIGTEREKHIPIFHNKEVFLQFIMNEWHYNIDYLAVNFAYPLQPIDNKELLDGILIRGTKEHTFTDLVGKPVGKIIQDAFFEKTQRKIRVTVANDAVCLVLSEADALNWNTIVGGIVGTGVNYTITLPKSTIVNLECGNFNGFTISESGMQIDTSSSNPGEQQMEKEIAGAYLFQHYNYYIKKNNLATPLLSTSSQLSAVASDKVHNGSQLARSILERSAALTASQMAGIHAFKSDLAGSTGLTGLTNLTFVMEGNLFWHGWQYKENVERNLDALGLHDSISFTQNEHHAIKGALQLIIN